MPDHTPLAPSVKPGGWSASGNNANVYGGTPPLTETVAEYAVPTTPGTTVLLNDAGTTSISNMMV